MAGIQEYLDLIKNAVYGRDVRQAIHDGIETCYKEGKAGATDLVAREEISQVDAVLSARIDEIIAPSGEAPSAAEVTDARIGADGMTYTSLGGAVRGQVTDLKSDLNDIGSSLGKENIGNLIMSATAGTIYRYNSSTGDIYTQENASYMCVVVDVSGLDYVTSTRNFGSANYQFFGTDTSFVATGASCRTTDAGYVFAVPVGATKLYLSYELSVWNIAVIEGRSDISTKTTAEYPVGGTWIFAEYNEISDKAETAYDAVQTTTTINTQYLDNSTKENGYYYSNDVKTANASYSIYAPVTVPAGTYYIGAAASTNFSYVKIGDTFSKLSALNPITLAEYSAYVVTVNAEATFYISTASSNTYKVPISTIPIKPNAEEYRFGDFLECPNKVVYVGTTRQYKTLKSAIEAVDDVFDAYIYVDAEEFDLVDEFGQAFLDAYSTAESFGLFLKNRVHLIFASGSKVVFNYTGSNAYVHEYFSPFNAGRYGFELIGANIESTNCRYSVHDEHGTENEPYRNIYKGCTMKHDSSATTWGAHQCIGGGLGLHGTIEISDCVFEAVGTNIDASYHAPSTSSNAQNRVSVENSYFAGTFRMSTYGTGTAKSYGYVKGNSCTSAPFVSHNEGSADNVEIIAWNNEIRS